MSVPVLRLTARSRVEDGVTDFDAGDDDYLPEHSALPRLLARGHAFAVAQGGKKTADSVFRVGDVTLDPVSHVA